MTTVRHAVRVLMLDEDDRVLLFRLGGRALWLTPGGGIEPGEDSHAAAARELWEETGQRHVSLEAEIWHRRHVFTWRETVYDQRERWFVAHVPHFVPDLSHVTEEEREDIAEVRWWTVAELRASADEFAPRDLAARLATLLLDGPPAAPIEIGV